MDTEKMLDKYRGCMVGALIGDCLGHYFEFAFKVDPKMVKNHIDRCENLKGEEFSLFLFIHPYLPGYLIKQLSLGPAHLGSFLTLNC